MAPEPCIVHMRVEIVSRMDGFVHDNCLHGFCVCGVCAGWGSGTAREKDACNQNEDENRFFHNKYWFVFWENKDWGESRMIWFALFSGGV